MTFLEFLYTDELKSIDEEIAKELLPIMEEFGMERLVSICQQTLNPQQNFQLAEQTIDNDLQQLFLSQKFADVTFLCEDRKLFAHKVILCTRSPYFNAMLNSGMTESLQKE